jgi:5'-nucleotidase
MLLTMSLFAQADEEAALLSDENHAVTITIVHTNDTHARVKEGDGMGFAKISALIHQIKQENPNTLVFDAGDTLHGQAIATLNSGESIAVIMSAIGYDAMAPGNHDFNYGYTRLAELDTIASFPILAANVKKADGTDLLTPYIIKEIAGMKVGIFGLATPETTYKTHPDNVKGLAFTDPVKAAAEMTALLQEQTDIIICLAHLGMDAASTVTSVKIAEEVEGIDLIIDGHSHTVLEQGHAVGDTLIVSTGEYDKNLGIVQLTVTEGQVTDKKASLISKDEAAEVVPDEAIVKTIETIEAEQAVLLSEVIGKTEVALEGARELVRKGETNLGNLIADAMVKLTGADCALTNGGGIRASIAAGDITKGNIIDVLPFGNYIVAKVVTGADIKAALENGTSAYPELQGGFPHVSGITYMIDTGKPVGDRIVDIQVKGKPLDLNGSYILATNDFLAAGGDNYTMFADDAILNEYGGLDEAVIAYVKEKGIISPKTEGRITVIDGSVKEPKYYIVKKGDWLRKIARMYNTTWQKLQELNQLKNPDLIYPNQKILLP